MTTLPRTRRTESCMTILTAWLVLSIGCSIGFVAGTLFASPRNDKTERSDARIDRGAKPPFTRIGLTARVPRRGDGGEHQIG